MVTLEQVAEMAMSLPETVEGERYGNRTWFVAGKAFAWDRPFSKADIKRYGDAHPPDGPIVAVQLADLHETGSVLASGQDGVFTIPHFDGYPAVLLHLRSARKRTVRDLMVDAWLACAPDDVARAHLPELRRRRQRR